MQDITVDCLRRPWTREDTVSLHCSASPRIVRWIRDAAASEVIASDASAGVVIDVGCGSGALIFAIAEFVPHVLGIDVSESLLRETEEKSRALGLANVRFRIADAETADYRSLTHDPIIMVVATLCMSDAIMSCAAKALRPASPFIFTCIEKEQWKEAGRPSRFAYDADTLRFRLREMGFQIIDLCLEREILEFESAEQMTDLFFDDGFLKKRWQRDGRWDAFLKYVQSGGRTFTARSHLLANTRRK